MSLLILFLRKSLNLKIILIFFFSIGLYSDFSYMGKIEPYEKIVIKSEVFGVVSYVNKTSSFSYLENGVFLKLDDKDDVIKIYELSKRVDDANEMYKISKSNFKSKKSIRSLSQFDKNREKLNMLQKKQTYSSLKESISLKKRARNKKIFKATNKYIGKIYPKERELVNVGSHIADIYNISKKKIVVFINKRNKNNIQNKDILINGIMSDFYIEKISNITDIQYISSYQINLIADNKDRLFVFGDIVKITFRDKNES